ncbi:hypothetical protein [Bdellovibrio reynosensis]|uniref:Uncharacterized protein n=1 Tax=Bdellovibrio reynosensis TaxID=2835041 RepID=A0ABY4CAN9_9BACT|nr:hypothetical protein [Bdellovibrio reynosensis]UOF01923.1 hypothetical protein MNR06_03010 [Bdellovibrio reynosensis]
MKNKTLIALLILIFAQTGHAQGLKTFLKSCGWGTVIGATAGVVSLAFTDKPSESWGNVSKGASLGLYAGIGYGLYNANSQPAVTHQEPDFAIIPSFEDGKLQGVSVTSTLFNF